MQVFIGGAYNGKNEYVKQLLEGQDIFIADGFIPEKVPSCEALVIKNIEKWLITQNLEKDEVLVADVLTRLKALDKKCALYIIVTDMGRGVVPMEKEARLLRDTCGRLYQALFTEAQQVVRIWYGLGETIK